MSPEKPLTSTADATYTQRLQRLQSVWWKRWLNVQAPYAWNLRRLEPGFMLDIGCGLGRNLAHVGGRGIGVDHNRYSVEQCRAMGLTAYTADEFRRSPHARPGSFDSMLLAHVVEHLTHHDAVALVDEYRGLLKKNGKVIVITPQERGFRSDASHVEFVGFKELERLAEALDLVVERRYSFPFPRFAGHFFTYNEFVAVFRSRDA